MPTSIAIDRNLKLSNNLSDLANITTARTNLEAAKSGANTDITSLVPVTNLGFGTPTPGCFQFSSKGVVIASSTAAATDPGAGNLSVSGGVTVSGSQLLLNNGTTNNIAFSANGVGTPTFTSRSIGTKLVLFGSTSASSVDYAIGIASGSLWNSIPSTSNGQQFSWYGGTTEVMRLNGAGSLSVSGSITNSNWKRLTLSSIGIAAFVDFVIPLHPRYTDTLIETNFCKGKIYLGRGGSVSSNHSALLEIDTQSAYNLNVASLKVSSNVYNFSLVTFIYQGISWLGIRCIGVGSQFASLSDYHFEGIHKVSAGSTHALTVVGYNNTNTSTVVNAEINGSLIDFTPNLPYEIQASGLNVRNGGISLTNTSSNLISYFSSGAGIPTFTTRSSGTKIVLFPNLNSANVDYAIGIASNTLWNSIPSTSSGNQFSWYGGTTELMRLRGDGNLGVGTPTPGCHQFSGKGVAIASSTSAVVDPGAGNLAVAGNSLLNGLSIAYRLTTTNYTAVITDCVIAVDATAAPITITLPTAVGNQGKLFRIKKVDASTNAVTINTTASQTIDGATTLVLTAQYAATDLVSSNANYFIF